MKIVDIKKEALNLMFASYEVIDDLDENSNEIGSYVRAMNGSIYRALQRILQKGLSPLKRLEAKDIPSEAILSENPLTIDTTKLDDFYKLERVIVDYVFYQGNADYRYEGRVLTLMGGASKTNATILYYKKTPKANELTDNYDLTDWGLDEDLQSIIPYFIKSELYREDDLVDARESLNIFNTYLHDRIEEDTNVQTSVRIRYNDEW